MGEGYCHAQIACEERQAGGVSGRVWMGKQAAVQTNITAISELKAHFESDPKVRRSIRTYDRGFAPTAVDSHLRSNPSPTVHSLRMDARP